MAHMNRITRKSVNLMQHPGRFKGNKPKKVSGLRSATPQEIEELKIAYPNGYHRTHDNEGNKYPFNGVFIQF